jgi:glyoxylase-like metal-dependent hydrolase (beta-lactamase superfamily II)
MSEPVQLRIGDVALTRVEYFDIALPAEVASLTEAQVRAADGDGPTWASTDGQVVVGQAMWVLEAAGRTIVVDPCGASDDFLRSGPEARTHQEAMLAAMTAAGFPPGAVDLVVLSHLDGIGIVAVVDEQGRWSPAFPAARIVMNAREVDFLASPAGAVVGGNVAFQELVAQGAVDPVGDDHEVADGVRLVHTGGHSDGHAVVRVASGGEEAVLLGHLAISPLSLLGPVAERAHADPARTDEVVDALLAEAVERGTVLIGPLWPRPGAGRVHPDDPRRVVAAGAASA